MRKSVVTLGTFDGVHRGHQAILRRVHHQARTRRASSIALTFQMPPRHAGLPRREPVLLTTPEEKALRLRALGIDRVVPLFFTRRLQRTPAERFFDRRIRQGLHAGAMIVGPKVAFGRNRAGRLPLLRRLGEASGIRIGVVPPVYAGRQAVSSRRIRSLIQRGAIRQAEALLGYPYSVEGRVVHGDGRGRVLGYPTANLCIHPDKILPPGVYRVKVTAASEPPAWSRASLRRAWNGVCNVGTLPTFHRAPAPRRCEVFLLQKPGRSLYGRRLRVFFLERLRSERRFESASALQAQIARDVERAKRFKL